MLLEHDKYSGTYPCWYTHTLGRVLLNCAAWWLLHTCRIPIHVQFEGRHTLATIIPIHVQFEGRLTLSTIIPIHVQFEGGLTLATIIHIHVQFEGRHTLSTIIPIHVQFEGGLTLSTIIPIHVQFEGRLTLSTIIIKNNVYYDQSSQFICQCLFCSGILCFVLA